ncbi:MAG TPA: hypothetical protein VGV37_00115 [Aliidongia sp.]|uniref:hypothetical protein n=1 Tax=Aliidongia sp. TaxID=1914230 RepID=UPI002DDCA6BF|nr:hypothetical protein [Aliidongia sp.]HEV2672911.1 hypothetical protein [Aliidongia sp.]
MWRWAAPLALLAAGALAASIARAETVDPQAILATAFPQMRALRQATKPEIAALEARLDADERAGADRSCLRQAVTELRWRLGATSDTAAALRSRDRLRSLAASTTNPPGNTQDADGSYGPCVEAWFWKLDASTDRFLDDDPVPVAPRFLDRINDPARLDAYLRGLLVSDLRRDGVDRRKELNIAGADLVRLILRRRPATYPWRADLEPVVRRFIAAAQDPATGFFGERYREGDRDLPVMDLSVTFHMARYLDGAIDHWPELVDHLIAIKHEQYPHGWLDADGMTSHNNYDVATLFRLGWPKLRPEQRPLVAVELAGLVDWCLGTALGPDGTIRTRADGESWPDALYFTAAFLDEAGIFDPAKRYWTDRTFPDAERIRAGLARQAGKLPPDEPMARAALMRLATLRPSAPN